MAEVKMSENAKKVAENFNPAQNIPYIQFVANKKNESGMKEINEKIEYINIFNSISKEINIKMVSSLLPERA